MSYPKSMQNTPQTFALLGFAFLLRNDNKNKLSTTGMGHQYQGTHTRSTAERSRAKAAQFGAQRIRNWRSHSRMLSCIGMKT